MKTLKIAIQKSGRLNRSSLDLLSKCGFKFEVRPNQLLCREENHPIELLLVRDDDIPSYVSDGVCDIGIVGLNVYQEKVLDSSETRDRMKIIRNLGFGKCRLAIAVPKNGSSKSISSLSGTKIATSYPNILADYLLSKNI